MTESKKKKPAVKVKDLRASKNPQGGAGKRMHKSLTIAVETDKATS